MVGKRNSAGDREREITSPGPSPEAFHFTESPRNDNPEITSTSVLNTKKCVLGEYPVSRATTRLEVLSGISYAQVAGIVYRPATFLLRGVAVIRKDCGCVRFDFCDCPPTNSNGGGTEQVIEISSDTAEVGESDVASVGSNRQF